MTPPGTKIDATVFRALEASLPERKAALTAVSVA